MSGSVDIVLLKANNQKKIYQDLSKDFTGIEPPLWLALTAAFLRGKGFSVAVIDAEADNLDAQETVARALALNPVLASVIVSGTNPSASTMNMPGARSVLNEFKHAAPRIPTAISGLHPSALPERTMREEIADFLFEGEGFTTHLDLLTALKQRKSKQEDLGIDGLWQRIDGGIVSHPRPQNIQDLGDIADAGLGPFADGQVPRAQLARVRRH